jgi:fructuronate reductase
MSETELERLELGRLSDLPAAVRRPAYDLRNHGTGIAHIGLGAFHRAHQAVYTDDALAAKGGDWRIVAISPRGTDVVDALAPQDGLYTVLTRRPDGTEARVIGCIAAAIAAAREPQRALAALADPAIRIVSITVTEKAYGILRASGRIDPAHPAIARDLADPRMPASPIGLIVEALRRRREAGTTPFAVLCCDNLPENGRLIRSAALDYAGRLDPALGDWIADAVAFPSTMVDRITPASTEETLREAERLTGLRDLGAVETEPFTQWVIEDDFPQGRPAWEAGGALFVEDVEPYERMKLRMLNGSHSLIAYAGHLSGCRYVRDAMAWVPLTRLVERNLAAAAATLAPLEAIEFSQYGHQLLERFGNPAIAHETYQIAMDGTEKLPHRHFLPAIETLERGGDISSFSFTTAAWMAYCAAAGRPDAAFELQDPRKDEIAAAVAAAGSDASALSAALHALPDLWPERLRDRPDWRSAVETRLSRMLREGMRAAVSHEAATMDHNR